MIICINCDCFISNATISAPPTTNNLNAMPPALPSLMGTNEISKPRMPTTVATVSATSSISGKATQITSKIIHPPEDLSLEEIRARKMQQFTKTDDGNDVVVRGSSMGGDVSTTSAPSISLSKASPPQTVSATGIGASSVNYTVVSSPMLIHGNLSSSDIYGAAGSGGGIMSNATIPPPMLNSGLSSTSVSAAAISKAQEVSSYHRYNSHSQ